MWLSCLKRRDPFTHRDHFFPSLVKCNEWKLCNRYGFFFGPSYIPWCCELSCIVVGTMSQWLCTFPCPSRLNSAVPWNWPPAPPNVSPPLSLLGGGEYRTVKVPCHCEGGMYRNVVLGGVVGGEVAVCMSGWRGGGICFSLWTVLCGQAYQVVSEFRTIWDVIPIGCTNSALSQHWRWGCCNSEPTFRICGMPSMQGKECLCFNGFLDL